MPVTFEVQITELRPAEMLQRVFNGLVRQALEAAARFWLRAILPRHFEPAASARYNYRGRSARWRRIKAEVTTIRKRDGSLVNAPKPPAPLVWSGDMKKDVLGKPIDSFTVRATATSNRQIVRVRVPLPHPIHPANAGELTRLNEPDRQEMQAVAVAELKRLLADVRSQQQTTIT